MKKRMVKVIRELCTFDIENEEMKANLRERHIALVEKHGVFIEGGEWDIFSDTFVWILWYWEKKLAKKLAKEGIYNEEKFDESVEFAFDTILIEQWWKMKDKSERKKKSQKE